MIGGFGGVVSSVEEQLSTNKKHEELIETAQCGKTFASRFDALFLAAHPEHEVSLEKSPWADLARVPDPILAGR